MFPKKLLSGFRENLSDSLKRKTLYLIRINDYAYQLSKSTGKEGAMKYFLPGDLKLYLFSLGL